MWLSYLRRLVVGKSRSSQVKLTRRQRRWLVPTLEHLEERIVPSTINVNDLSGGLDNPVSVTVSTLGSNITLRDAINAANNTSGSSGGTYVINLPAGTTITFTSPDNTTNGPNVLPVVTASDLTIVGNGSTLNAGSYGRLFDVSSSGGLTLENLTLTGGKASGATAAGGAVYDSGAHLTLTTVKVNGNAVTGSGQTVNGLGHNAQGGGLYISGGTVKLTNSDITANFVSAATGAAGAAGGNAQGGGIYASGTTLTLSVCGGAVNGNTLFAGDGGNGASGASTHAAGGAGGASGLGQGGGVFAQGGLLTITNAASVTGNAIEQRSGGQGGSSSTGAGGAGGAGGNSDGGGVFAFGATVCVEGGATVNDNTLYGAGGGNGGVGKAGGVGANAGSGLGGGVYVQGGSVTISGANTEVAANSVFGGPGGAAAGGASGGRGGEADGGGLYALNAPVITITGSATLQTLPTKGSPVQPVPGIDGNSVEAGNGGTGAAGGAAEGGGVYVSGTTGQSVSLGSAATVSCAATIADIEGNTATAGKGGAGSTGGAGGKGTGGGVTIYGDTLALNNATIYDNSLFAGSGGTGSSHGNGGDAQGAGLFVSGSTSASVLNSLFFANESVGGSSGTGGSGGNAEGGGFYSNNNSTVNVLNSTFDVNKISGGLAGTAHSPQGGETEGGGLFASGGSLTLVNDTVAWNELVIAPYQGSPAAQGGGVYNTTGSMLSLTNTILALDQIYSLGTSSTTVSYDDFDGSAAVNDLIGNSTSYSNYATGGNDPSYAVGGSQQLFVGSEPYTPPAFFSGEFPANYGGLTYTLPLAWNTSPAIDTGDPNATGIAGVTTDQRGLPRVISDTIDIGATETQVTLTGSAAPATPATVPPGGTITYTLYVTNNESTMANVTLTDALDANTTYQSYQLISGGKNWIVTPPSSSNPNAFTASFSLDANSMAKLTITVSVSSTVSNGTTIANTASITPTGSSATEQRSTKMDTNVGTSVANTSTSLTASANPSVYGQPVTFTATVSDTTSGSSFTPTGAVQFIIDGSNYGSAVTLVNGSASVMDNALTVSGSPHSIVADYLNSDGDFQDSNGSLTNGQTVTPATTSTAVVSSAANNTSVYGQNVTFTATVSNTTTGSSFKPTGSVQFIIDGSNYGSAVTLVNGSASISDNALTVTGSPHSIVADYLNSDGDFQNSNGSLSGGQTVNKANTTTTVTASASSPSFGQTVTFTATVTAKAPGAGTPSGSVDFFDTTTNTDLTPGGVALSSGTATYSTSNLPLGSNTITATYSGDGNFNTSSGTTATPVTVNASIVVLDPTAVGALSLSGNASISLTTGDVVVDSNSKTALTESGNSSIKAASIQVVGGVSKSGNATLSPAATTGVAVVPDPLAGLLVPAVNNNNLPNNYNLSNQGSVNLSGTATRTISPGVYSQISVSGSASLTLNPGVYILAGGGLTVSGNASISGSGVMLFNAGSTYNATTGTYGGTYGSITLSGNGTYALSAPTTGTYAGILIFQDRNNSRALTLSGNSTLGTSGTIYAKTAALTLSGNAQGGTSQQPTLSFVVDTMTLSGNSTANALGAAPAGTVAYTPAQIRAAYGINDLSLDGTGQTIAIVDAYDDPDIYQALDTFDSQFGLTATGPTLYNQYGTASSFLTVLNQNGQPTSLPGTDPAGAGNANWEMEEALDVEWAHAIAPGAKIVLVEANSQSLSDLMAGAATAASQPGVSVVSMSWGFAEGVDVLSTEEAQYDSTFIAPGVTFVASTGDYGAADPEYPAFSPNVVAVGGTSLTLNANNSYNSETGWGYSSASVGAFIGSGGGISLYEAEPAFQQGVQSTGYRTTPDVSFVADPATGAWIADPYNLPSSNPFEVAGGTSLSAPAWAGLLALVNQGRVAAGEKVLNSSSPTQAQQDLYSLSQADYNVIASGSNGYSAAPGYNLVTGLGTPVANLLVPDLIAGNFPTTGRVAAAGAAQLIDSSSSGSGNGSPLNAFNVFDALTAGPAVGYLAHSSGSDMTTASSTSIPSSGSPPSVADQEFADLALLLSAARNAFQSELSSVSALWQQADALVLQRLDALWGLEAGAMGMSKDTLMSDPLFASKSASNSV